MTTRPITYLALLLTSLSLASCQNRPTATQAAQEMATSQTKKSETAPSTSSSQPSTSSSDPSSSSSSPEASRDEATASQTVTESPASSTEVQESPSSEPEAQVSSNHTLYPTTLHLVATDPTPGRATHYAFFDIDGNGTAELITANSWGGQLTPAAIYYLQNGVSTYLARAYVADGGGRRETFTIYHDGTVEWDEWSSGNGQGTAYLYQLAPDNSGHWVIGQADFNQRELPDPGHVNQFDLGKMVLDFSSLNWTAF